MKLTNLIPIKAGKTLSRLCIIGALSLGSSFVFAQNQQVRLSGNNLTLKAAFKQIEQQTKLFVDYNTQDVNDSRVIKKVPAGDNVKNVLEQLLEGMNCSVTFSNGHVIISRKAPASSETKKVTGIVKDEKGITLPGVSVIVKGTQTGVATDINGRFEIKVDDEPNLILQFSFVGMKTKEIKIGNNQELKVVLESAAESLDEVIVTGYQTISKERTTGSFGVITPRNIETKLQSNLSSVLEGQATGVVLDKDGKIEIRGVSTFNAENEPLVVLDGYPIEGGLESINPENIENITVLKDGVAASIYGSRAANGVIVVTTTRGAADRFNVSYKGIVSTILKPQLSKLNRASTSDYIDAELDLYYQNPDYLEWSYREGKLLD